MALYEFRNPVWANAEHTKIDIEINHPDFGWIPFTASPTDVEEHGRDLYAAALEAGNIGPYVAPPPQPYDFQIGSLWDRLTDDEAEEFDSAASTASPLKMRKQFQLATSMLSDSELFAWVRGILVGLFGETRADELLVEF